MKTPRADSFKPEKNDDCRVLAPFVMTLFDGEADEFEARRARAHLLVCQTCARRWLDWNRSRDLLRLAPVAAPPPQLLWRVLMACRLAAAPKQAKSRQAPSEQLLPGDFQSQIFARTTRAAQVPARRMAPMRWSHFAVPALAAWMLILQRDAWLPAPVASLRTSNLTFSPASPPLLLSRRAESEARKMVAPRGPSSQPRRVLATSKIAPPATNLRFANARAAKSRGALHLASANVPVAIPAASQITSVPGPRSGREEARVSAQPEAAVEQELPLVAAELAPTRHTARVLPRLASPRTFNEKLAVFSDQNREPREHAAPLLSLRHGDGASNRAPHALPGNLETGSVPQLLRVSLPSARAPQPARFLAENLDSEDEGIEEVRSVVDDFRATLGPDDATTADASPNDEDPAG